MAVTKQDEDGKLAHQTRMLLGKQLVQTAADWFRDDPDSWSAHD